MAFCGDFKDARMPNTYKTYRHVLAAAHVPTCLLAAIPVRTAPAVALMSKGAFNC